MRTRSPLQLLAPALCASAVWRTAAGAALGDAAALIQGEVRARILGGDAEAGISSVDAESYPGADRKRNVVAAASLTPPANLTPSDAVRETERGPMVDTELGPILGRHEKSVTKGGYLVFKGVPYGEPPQRFAAPEPKRPWGPELLEARQWQPSCIGCGFEGKEESEDCLSLNVWLTPGGHTGMPVIVYLHGGMNQGGTADDPSRQGDLVVQSAGHPVIFVHLNYRLGIFGWIDLEDASVPKNLGFRDQQLALSWVQRHIRAFGGDPSRVTLMGQSEGAGAIVAHLVSPGSKGLFQRASLHSPPADFTMSSVNRARTDFMVKRLGCLRETVDEVKECLNRPSAEKIWGMDWVAPNLIKNVGSFEWFRELNDVTRFFGNNFTQLPGYLGWHYVVDGDTLPDEPRKLIAQGKYHNVQVLVTTARNESLGAFNNAKPMDEDVVHVDVSKTMFEYLLKPGDQERVIGLYVDSLKRQGLGLPASMLDLVLMMITDKVWLCEVRSLARDIAATGGDVRVGLFEHAPKWDPVGSKVNQLCLQGASCHAADMYYMLPQDPARGGIPEKMAEEHKFAMEYRDTFLKFVGGEESAWVPFNLTTEPIAVTNSNGTRIVQGYHRQQCEILDSSMGDALPDFMKARSARPAEILADQAASTTTR